MKIKFDTKVNKTQYHINRTLMTYFTLKVEKDYIKKTNLEIL